jgi:hypothetical protein
MARKTLRELYSHFVARTNLLVEKYDFPIPPDTSHRDMCNAIHSDGRALMIIRLQLLWGEFCRELVMRSALGGYLTITGTFPSASPALLSLQAIQQAINLERRGRPPAWHSPVFALAVARRLNIQNYDQVSLALTQASPVDDLRTIRNYIVHPSEFTRIPYVNITWRLGSPGTDPVSLLAVRLPGGATRYETWVADLQTMVLDAVR